MLSLRNRNRTILLIRLIISQKIMLKPGVVTKGLVEIYTLSGKSIFNEPASFTSEKKMNIKNLSPGVYIVKLFDGE